MIARKLFGLALLLVALPLTGCEELTDVVLNQARVELRPTGTAYTEWTEGDWDTPAGYLCEPQVMSRARGGSEYPRIEWTSGRLILQNADGETLNAYGLSGGEVDRYLSRPSADRWSQGRPMELVAQESTFRWILTVRYIDLESYGADEREASTSGVCEPAVPGS